MLFFSGIIDRLRVKLISLPLSTGIAPQYQFFDFAPDPFTGEMHHHPLSYQMKVQNADSPTLREVLQLTDPEEKALWFIAMDEELTALLGNWNFSQSSSVSRPKSRKGNCGNNVGP